MLFEMAPRGCSIGMPFLQSTDLRDLWYYGLSCPEYVYYKEDHDPQPVPFVLSEDGHAEYVRRRLVSGN